MEAIGFMAALLTTVSFIPQAVKSVRERNTTGISLSMYSFFTAGIFLWLIYGLLKSDLPLIVANAITLVFASIVLMMKLKYK